MTTASSPTPHRPAIGLFSATMLVVGNTIGVGIFTTSGIVLQQAPSPGWMLVVWLLGGLLAIAGALTWAELGAMFPEAGGEYVYLREAFGPFWAFLCGWAAFLASFSGSIAVLATALAEYVFAAIAPPHGAAVASTVFLSPVQGLAVVLVWAVSLLNYRGLRLGSITQNILSVTKLVAIGGLGFAGFIGGNGAWEHFSPLFAWRTDTFSFRALGLALIPVLFTYSGWNAAAYIASEVREPETTVPRALTLGTLITIGVYLGLNVLYVFASPVAALSGEVRIGELTARALFGARAAEVVSVVIVVSIAGALNVMVLTGARIYFAMARDRVFFAPAARLHPRFHSPGNALLLQAGWTSLLICSGTFEQLLTYSTAVIVAVSILTVSAVFLLRWRRPALLRPYQTWGYPWLPALYLLGSLGILVNAFVERPTECFWGLGLCLAGVPAYWWWQRVDRGTPAA
jgi:APA family basic amino acid/polyamine antiporter